MLANSKPPMRKKKQNHKPKPKHEYTPTLADFMMTSGVKHKERRIEEFKEERKKCVAGDGCLNRKCRLEH